MVSRKPTSLCFHYMQSLKSTGNKGTIYLLPILILLFETRESRKLWKYKMEGRWLKYIFFHCTMGETRLRMCIHCKNWCIKTRRVVFIAHPIWTPLHNKVNTIGVIVTPRFCCVPPHHLLTPRPRNISTTCWHFDTQAHALCIFNKRQLGHNDNDRFQWIRFLILYVRLDMHVFSVFIVQLFQLSKSLL